MQVQLKVAVAGLEAKQNEMHICNRCWDMLSCCAAVINAAKMQHDVQSAAESLWIEASLTAGQMLTIAASHGVQELLQHLHVQAFRR